MGQSQIKISLIGSKPPIWRRFVASNSMTLSRFHDLLQIVMGWEDSHLHQYRVGSQYFGVPDPDFPQNMKNEARVTLAELMPVEGASAIYEYDFGDGWEHKLVVEKVLPHRGSEPLTRCLGGRRACPPEDCGGIPGYQRLLEAVGDPDHPEHGALSQWLGDGFDPDRFDVSIVNYELGKHFGRQC